MLLIALTGCAGQPEWLARREQARQVKPLLRANLPAVEEPPYAEFFNARIAREIGRELAPVKRAAGWNWRRFLPAAAVAGMALCFWAGTRAVPAAVTVMQPPAGAPAPVLYTPEKGVKAAYFDSAPAEAMVIVLDGVAAIPDSFEVPDTASAAGPANSSTADLAVPAP